MTLLYDSFTSAAVTACRLLLCAVAALFLSAVLTKDITIKKAVVPLFFVISLISCNAIFLISDLHILLSLAFFLLALFFSSRCRALAPLFAAFCVFSQPLTLLILVPAIVIVQALKKQKLFAIISAVAGIAAFIVTKLLENTAFYADQFSSYYLSLHIFHLSTTHKTILMQYLLCSIPLLLVGAFYLIKAFINGSKAESIAFVIVILLALFGYALSKNTQSVFMLLIPLFAGITALDTEANEQVGGFFAKRMLLLLLAAGISVCAPMLLDTLPYDTELFSRSTFIIFREQ
ncbi:MAG: hypothetical protein IKV49_03685 [Clostridia bacterium]|nr:hypothetical protein [Clostridia bacterium]